MKKITLNSPVVLLFALACGGAYVANIFSNGWALANLFTITSLPWNQPMTYVRLICHIFGHTSIEHLYGNMLLFLLIGPLLEEKYGSLNIAIVILITAVVTGIAHIFLSPDTLLCGASGVVFAFILLAGVTGSGSGVPLTMIIVAAMYITKSLYDGFNSPQISQMAHILGGIIGGVFGMVMKGKN